MSDTSPVIDVYSHTECDDLDLDWLTAKAREALPHCLEFPGTETPVLPELKEVEVSILSDEAIGEVHGEVMDDATPTDVITFHHGEILVSVDTARREGPAHGNAPDRETLLYIIHGLLHLNGHTDLVEPDREVMHKCQEEILEVVTANI